MVLTPSFVAPPTDGSVPPALAVDFHHQHNPHHIFTVLYHSATSSQTQVTYEQLACAVHRVAYILNPYNTIPQGTNVGLLVSTSSLEYLIMVLGVMRAGLVPFPISPRIHTSGITHLLTTTRTSLVLAGGNDAIDSTTAQLAAILNESNFNVKIIELSIMRDILTLIQTSRIRFEPFPSLKPMDNSSIVTVLHSSGSTGMPKAIKYHLEGVVKNIINKPHGWTSSELVGTMALPTFHCLGLVIQVLEPLYTGYTQVLLAPARVPVVPNPNSTLKAIEDTKCTFLVCVPAFLEAWAYDEDAIAILKRIKGIMFGGGPLTDVIGNELVNRGIRIYSGFGGTEFGSIHVAPPHEHNARDWPWNYFKVSPQVEANFVAQNDQDNTFELVFEVGGKHHPFVLNSELNGKATYKTRDLLTPHPFKSDFWKFIGRVDDQVALLNGEKINPRPMEAEIAKCSIVQSAVVFGQARNQTGVLIELRETLETLSDIENKRKELVGILWPYFQRANQASPTHSRLDKRAVVFVDPARPLPRAPKGTILRSAALKLYAPDIEEMYAALEKDSDADILDDVEPLEEWVDPGAVTVWVSGHVKSILGKDIDPTMDLFQQGMDSLTATILLRTLRATLYASRDPNARKCAQALSQTVVFDNPTAQQLAHILGRRIVDPNAPINHSLETLERIHNMIQKYDSPWSCGFAHSARHLDTLGEYVVVTGTTGGLGSHLLAQLLASDRVGRVWALNRKSGGDTRDRQRVSFEDKMLDVGLLANKKLVFMDAILDDAKLGLDNGLYDEIRNTATIIIHNAWQVNFNLALQSFEQNIQGTRNLLDLAFSSTALTGPPRFAFASSISVAGLSGVGGHLDEVSVRPEDAMPITGYGQSKLVAEKLLESARKAGLQTCIVRLGQLTGDIKSGSWTTTDWVPSIVASSLSAGCLPAAVGTVSWLPLDVAARSIIDTCTTRDEDLPPVIHASHPRPVPWVDIMSELSSLLASRTRSTLPLVEFSEWNKRVIDGAAILQGPDTARYKRYPTTKIQNMMDKIAYADQQLRSRAGDEEVESAGTVRLVTTKAQQTSEALSGAPRLGREYVERWLNYWETKGLFVEPA